MKFQLRRGQHGAFWMKPQTPGKTPGNPKLDGAEIDVIEWFGKSHPEGGLSTHAYYQGRNGRKVKLGDWIRNPDRFLTGRRDSWYSRFHVFSVEWTPSRYIYRIDGKEVCAYHAWDLRPARVPHPQPAELRLGAAVPRQRVEAAADDEGRLGPPLGEVTRKGALDLILTSSLFDQAWYELVADTRFRSRRAAVEHYLRHVDRGWSPHPLFEAVWLFPHDGWRRSSADPLSHYLRTDARLSPVSTSAHRPRPVDRPVSDPSTGRRRARRARPRAGGPLVAECASGDAAAGARRCPPRQLGRTPPRSGDGGVRCRGRHSGAAAAGRSGWALARHMQGGCPSCFRSTACPGTPWAGSGACSASTPGSTSR